MDTGAASAPLDEGTVLERRKLPEALDDVQSTSTRRSTDLRPNPSPSDHQQAFDTADAATLENDNYRYYIASGSRHTGFGNPRVYDDTTGGVPTLLDWINAMIADSPDWVNVEADPFNVLSPGVCSAGSSTPGARRNLNVDCENGTCVGDDVKPEPLQPPFELVGSGPDASVVVNCED